MYFAPIFPQIQHPCDDKVGW